MKYQKSNYLKLCRFLCFYDPLLRFLGASNENIPCLILMNWLVGLYGMIWTQLIIEMLMLPVTIGMYAVTWRKLVN